MKETEEKRQEEAVKARVKVLVPFRDKYDRKVRYGAGEELEFEPERAEDVVSRGLAAYVEPEG